MPYRTNKLTYQQEISASRGEYVKSLNNLKWKKTACCGSYKYGAHCTDCPHF